MSDPGESRSQCKQVAGKQNSQAGQLDINEPNPPSQRFSTRERKPIAAAQRRGRI